MCLWEWWGFTLLVPNQMLFIFFILSPLFLSLSPPPSLFLLHSPSPSHFQSHSSSASVTFNRSFSFTWLFTLRAEFCVRMPRLNRNQISVIASVPYYYLPDTVADVGSCWFFFFNLLSKCVVFVFICDFRAVWLRKRAAASKKKIIITKVINLYGIFVFFWDLKCDGSYFCGFEQS